MFRSLFNDWFARLDVHRALARWLTPENTVRLAYRLVLRREATDDEAQWHCRDLAALGLPAADIFPRVAASAEAREAAWLAEAGAESIDDLALKLDDELFHAERLKPETVTRLAYRLALNRGASGKETAFHAGVVRDNHLPTWYVFKQLVTSPKFEKTLNPSHAIRL